MFRKILFYYCFILSVFLFFSGLINSQNIFQLGIQLLFLPVLLYFSVEFLAQVRGRKILLPFSAGTSRSSVIGIVVVFVMLSAMSGYSIVKVYSSNKPQPVVMSTVVEFAPTATPILMIPSPTVSTALAANISVQEKYQKNNINIYLNPSKDATIIGKMKYGAKYSLITTQGEWFQIQLENAQIGFVHQEFVQKQP